MSFKCEHCGVVQKNGTKVTRFVTEKRNKEYTNKIEDEAPRYIPRGDTMDNEEEIILPDSIKTTHGWEIVKEKKVCPICSKSLRVEA